MPVLLSKSCEYAIRASLYVASVEVGRYTSVREVSDALGIPYPFLAKIAQTLTQAGLFQALRGPTGGVALARPASAITLRDVVVATDGASIFTECVLGLPGCGNQKPCPLHNEWAPARARVEQMFGAATLAETAARVRAEDFRLASGPAAGVANDPAAESRSKNP